MVGQLRIKSRLVDLEEYRWPDYCIELDMYEAAKMWKMVCFSSPERYTIKENLAFSRFGTSPI
jgi:hypothetical protein